MDKSDYPMAEGLYRQAVKMDIGNGKYLSHLGTCLFKEGKDNEAKSIMNQAKDLGYKIPSDLMNQLHDKIHVGPFHF
jgi:Tfp pilus assembly protein PilF